MAIFNKEYIEKCLLENAKDINDIYKPLIIFFAHVLKWRYQFTDQGRNQTTSWIGTIIEQSRNINNVLYAGGSIFNTNFLKSGEHFIEEAYVVGKEDAEKETGIDLSIDFIETDNVHDYFNNFYTITDFNIIVEWLYSHARFEKARERVMQNDDVYKLYTGTKYKADWYHYNRKRIEEEKKKSKKK